MEITYKMELEAEVENELARILKEEIDKEIIIETLIADGWTQISLDKAMDDSFQDSGSIEYWLDENCQGRYTFFPPYNWLFKEPQDAELFILKWTR